MKTLFSKILLAQIVAVVLALAVVAVITRTSLNQGFKEFLDTQETGALKTLAPLLGEFYESQGGWEFLVDNPANWGRVLRLTRPQPGGPPVRDPGSRRGRFREEFKPPREPASDSLLNMMRPHERGMLRNRLFLLDENRVRIAGAEVRAEQDLSLESVLLDGKVIGWIGFTPMGNVLPPDAERFLNMQIRISMISFSLALVVAVALAYLLARNVSRPVRQLVTGVKELSRGEYMVRASVETRDEIGRLASHVNQLAETLEKNRTVRQRWMADIAHELRTPVAILKGEIEAFADGVRQADDRMSTSLREEVDHLSQMVDDLQALALADAGALNLHKEKTDLSLLLSQAGDSFRPRLADRGIRLELQAEDEVTLPGDPHRLRQLLHNLLQNSCSYVERNGLVRMRLRENRGQVEFLLEDSGPGVIEEQLGKLFDRFFRVESSRSRATGGTGLGLSICRNIVEAHGGKIQALHSELGGLKIQILLPG